jgi:hypothetical protein
MREQQLHARNQSRRTSYSQKLLHPKYLSNPIASQQIQYTVPTAANISIKVYDVTGREVGQLFKGNRTAGTYSVDYNTSKLGKGIYYCRMLATSGDKEFVITYKMVKVE